MANDTALLSTVLGDAVTSSESNASVLFDDRTSNLWRYGWPPLCVTGLVGNTLVLLVLRRDGLVRTSANVYLCVLAIGDSLVLMVASVAVYPGVSWGLWLDRTSLLACHTVWPIHYSLVVGSTWIIVAFTVERCVAVSFPLLKLRLCTPHNAGLCCVMVLVLACVNNIDLFFMYDLTLNQWGDVVCEVPLPYQDYIYIYRPWVSLVVSSVIPTCIMVVCNWAIIRTLRRKLMQTVVRDSVMRTTSMCLGVSFAFTVCVIPANVFFVVYDPNNWPVALPSPSSVWRYLVLLRYANHAINFFLYSLTGAHFRCELVAVFRSCTLRGCAAAAVVRRIPTHVTSRFKFRRGFEDDIEMH